MTCKCGNPSAGTLNRQHHQNAKGEWIEYVYEEKRCLECKRADRRKYYDKEKKDDKPRNKFICY